MKTDEVMKKYCRILSMFISAGTFLALAEASSAETTDNSLWTRSNLLGDPGGYRAKMKEKGFVPELSYWSTAMANVSGGIDEGSAYKGHLQVGWNADLDTLFGLSGGRAFFSAVSRTFRIGAVCPGQLLRRIIWIVSGAAVRRSTQFRAGAGVSPSILPETSSTHVRQLRLMDASRLFEEPSNGCPALTTG
jgi:hypothetical protein